MADALVATATPAKPHRCLCRSAAVRSGADHAPPAAAPRDARGIAVKLRRQLFRPGRRIEQIGRLAAHPFFTRNKAASQQGGRTPATHAANPRWLPRAAENAGALFSLVLSVVLLVAVLTLLYAFVRELRRDEVELGAFSAPRELADRGYTSSVIAEHVLQEIRAIQTRAPTQRTRRQVGSDASLPDIQMAASGLSMHSVVRYARGLLGLPDNRIDGEILQDGTRLRMTMRVREGRAARPLAVTREDANVERLLEDAGRAIVQVADPYVLAAYLFDRESASGEFPATNLAIDYVLTHPPADDDAAALDLRGDVRHEEGNDLQALESYRRALATDPNEQASAGIVDSLLRLGRDTEASAFAAGRIPKARTVDELEQASYLQHALGDWHGLLDTAYRYVATAPGSAWAHVALSHALLHAHRPAEALEAADRGLALDASNFMLRYFRTSALLELGRAQEALEASDATVVSGALAGRPAEGDAFMLWQRAESLLLLGRGADALAEYQAVVARQRNPNRLRMEWGDLLIALGHAGEALAIERFVLRETPRYWPAHVTLARALVVQGKPAEAVRHLEIAALGDPDDPAVPRAWAVALAAMGKPAEAAAKQADADRLEARLKLPPATQR
jgi:predicted Zn-dependent protease